MKIKVLQIIDTLSSGGAEKMAVNIAITLDQKKYDSYLIATRDAGPFKDLLSDSVKCKIFNKKSFFDVFTFYKILEFIKKNKIDVIHAHSTSLFWSLLLKIFCKKLKLIWHDHYGPNEEKSLFSRKFIKYFSFIISAIIVVNDNLYEMWKNKFNKPNKVFYLKNFSHLIESESTNYSTDIIKIVCLARFSDQKDLLTLLKAIVLLKEEISNFKLILAGGGVGSSYYNKVLAFIKDKKITNQVEVAGFVKDINSLLLSSDIGVISSISEGLPLSLIEYGLAALPVVVTDVGACSEVLKDGKYGIIVPPSSHYDLANSLKMVISNLKKYKKEALEFKNHIQLNYGYKNFHAKYEEVLNKI